MIRCLPRPDGSVRVLKSDLDQMRAQIKAELAEEMRQELYNQLRAEVPRSAEAMKFEFVM